MNAELTGDRGVVSTAHPKSTTIDVSEPAYESFLEDVAVEITARAEELHPGDPGQLSGAVLSLIDINEDMSLGVSFGTHSLGLLSGVPLLHFVSEALAFIEPGAKAEGGCIAKLAELYRQIDGRLSGIDLQVFATPEPTLKIMCGRHCFGVVVGRPLRRFLEAALVRACFGKPAPPEHLAIASEIVRICLSRPQQDLGEVQEF